MTESQDKQLTEEQAKILDKVHNWPDSMGLSLQDLQRIQKREKRPKRKRKS